MLRSSKKLRFTRGEVDEFCKIGIDAAGVKTQADWEAAITQWADVLESLSRHSPLVVDCQIRRATIRHY